MPRSTGKAPPRSKWWNEAWDEAMRALMHTRGPQREMVRGRLQATIRKAKHDWAMDIVQRATHREVWSLCQWASGKCRQRTPPIRHGDSIAIDPHSQCHAFAETFFPRTAPSIDPVLRLDPAPLPPWDLTLFSQLPSNMWRKRDAKQENPPVFKKPTLAFSTSSKGAEYDCSSIFTCLTEKGKGTQGDTEGDDDEEMEYYINSFTDEDLLSVELDGKGKSIRSDTMGGSLFKVDSVRQFEKRGVDEVSPPVIGEDDRSQRQKLSYKMADTSPCFLSIGREVPISGYTSLGWTGYMALIPASSSSLIGRGGKNWNSPALNIRTGQASFSDRIPSSSAGPSIMAQQQRSITAEGDFE
ncbi:hypothetical protein BU17DRAFT_102596 [Hysterangium stoloniferum]|nr:hypothetical protein BU17DRAFT_102596 [Hysterangium stoloniferum]